jgi:thioesterase domain-containing protein
MEGVMYIYSKRYRYKAAECLKASLEAREALRRQFQISMALSLYWTTVVSDILRGRTAGEIGTLILIGHSRGGNDSIEIARGLEVSRVPVDLLVTFDPYRQKPVPANVARAINYYQTAAGAWRSFPRSARHAAENTNAQPNGPGIRLE